MVHRTGRATKNRVGKGVAFANGHGRQVHPIGHIPHGVNTRHRCLAIAVNWNSALRVQCDADGLQPQTRGVGFAPQRPQHTVGVELQAVV